MADAVRMPGALTATVVAVCTPTRMKQTSAALAALRERSAVRTIAISLGSDPQPRVEGHGDAITIAGIVPRFLNNAVASLRLSSLPSIAWWQGTEPHLLPDLAELVDRLVLDSESAGAVWHLVPQLAEVTQVSDLRWTRLTRWRSLMAQLFDFPGVGAQAKTFDSLRVAGEDRDTAALFAAWVTSRLEAGTALRTEFAPGARQNAFESVTLSGNGSRLSLELLPNDTCIATTVVLDRHTVSSRVVSRGDHTIDALLREELRIRARDQAFEEAVRAVMERQR